MYPRRELNPYFRCGKLDFKSSASTSSATRVKRYEQKKSKPEVWIVRAEDRARTGHPDLGKVVLYQMSYFRKIKKELLVNILRQSDHLLIRIFCWTAKITIIPVLQNFTWSFFNYLYCGVYSVLAGTSTSGFPL